MYLSLLIFILIFLIHTISLSVLYLYLSPFADLFSIFNCTPFPLLGWGREGAPDVAITTLLGASRKGRGVQ
jgi:hypothetical protein